MAVKSYTIKGRAGCVMDLRAPFNSDRCKLRLKFMQRAEDFPGRRDDRHYTVEIEPDVHEVICAMQQLRRWLIDRKTQADEDIRRAGLYRSGDKIYR